MSNSSTKIAALYIFTFFLYNLTLIVSITYKVKEHYANYQIRYQANETNYQTP